MMLCKRWRNTNDELVPGSFIFIPGFRDKKYQSKTKRGQMARFDTLNRGRTVFFNGGNDDSLYQNICFDHV
jgi:hypothetical protein